MNVLTKFDRRLSKIYGRYIKRKILEIIYERKIERTV